MKFSYYIRDSIAGICISVFTYLLMLFFMCSFSVSGDMILILSIIFFTGAVSRFLWEYFRKYRFYSSLISGVKQLDKKYLISELIEEPDFLEGKIVHEALYESGKTMNESIDIYRKGTEEFQEYIELWVHEIKLPVSSLLLMSHNDENGAKYEKQLQKIDSHIENVLYYSRSESLSRDYIIKPVVPGNVFKNVALKNRNELQSLDVSINTDGLEKTVTTDEKWLEFITNQIISNSMKYFSDSRKPELHIFTEETADCIVFHIKDNGIGIPESDLPYIFDKSYTGENGRTHSRSTGMGLYIVKNLCRQLGHRIEVRSVRDEYTDIFISFGKNDHVKPV